MDQAAPKRRYPLVLVTGTLSLVVAVIAVGAVVLSILAYSNALSAIHEIKQSRKSSIITSCREQNERHDKTLAVLDVVYGVESRALAPMQRQEAGQTQKVTVLLVNALAPVKNCQARAEQLTKP
jgi:hypothetical protein